MGDFAGAQKHAEEARRIHQDRIGFKSTYVSEDFVVLAEIALARGDLETSERLSRMSLSVLEEIGSPEIVLPDAKKTLGRIMAATRKGHEARRLLLSARAHYVGRGRWKAARELDQELLHAAEADGFSLWSASALDYARYLERFPDCIHAQTARRIAKALQQEPNGGQVLDLYCGTGLVSQCIEAAKPSNIGVLGLDCEGMISTARRWADALPPDRKVHVFRTGGASSRIEERFRFVTMNMAIFQFDLLERFLLLEAISRLLDDGGEILFSTSSADFLFQSHALDQESEFKRKLFEVAESEGLSHYIDGTLESAMTPTFSKDDYYSFSRLFECFGFNLEIVEPVITHERTAAERVAWSRIPVISKKIFGKELPRQLWRNVEERLGRSYKDPAHAIVLRARIDKSVARNVYLFIDENLGTQSCEKIWFAAAAVITTPEGRFLYVRRGPNTRDLQGVWSLPSTMAEGDESIRKSLTESLEKNLGLSDLGLDPVSLRIARRDNIGGTPGILVMSLFRGHTSSSSVSPTAKYPEHRWERPDQWLTSYRSKTTVGDCTKSFVDLLRIEGLPQ